MKNKYEPRKHEFYDDFNENLPVYICWHVEIADFIWTVETAADKQWTRYFFLFKYLQLPKEDGPEKGS